METKAFIERWKHSSGKERANFPSFANELCQLLDVKLPDPSTEDDNYNNYAFERSVDFKYPDGSTSKGRIDLYKRGCFVMEAKQSRLKDRAKAITVKGQPELFPAEQAPRGQRSANRAWDQLMLNARRQAEFYAKALPPSHGWPPFILVCDVGHCIEVYADFSGQGKNYTQFPNRQHFRVYLEDLRDEAVRERLRLIWEDPYKLDPARQSAKVTRDIAGRLAEVSKGLEKRGHGAEEVALFLMRCLFTMFAEDVELLPRDSFTKLLRECADDPEKFVPLAENLWQAMDSGDFAHAIREKVKRFNGHLFADASALPLEREEIGELQVAAKYDWREVEPAIFGTLLEQALDSDERSRLGAHYTPRAYVERLVVATVIEPLRADWAEVEATAERLNAEGRNKEAVETIRAFHNRLCNTRVLDPACGTGNFLYVSLELMKRLEGDVLEALAALGGEEAFSALEGFNVDPHQFLGLEINPRAVEIAELVLWLGYLQWHFRTKSAPPSEPILRDFKNIEHKDAVLDWNGDPASTPKRPEWPQADFIVGNPPFTGGKDVRDRHGDAYAKALWAVHKHINESADFVMYWWDRAAEIVARGSARRFGLVTTNSITQVFSRRVVANHLTAKQPVSLLMAIPDHPWTKETRNSAAVRIAMTVAGPGKHDGVLRKVVREEALDTDEPVIAFEETRGRINSDLTVGVDLGGLKKLASHSGLSSRGMSLHGNGFIVTPQEAEQLGLGKRPGLERHIRAYRHGKDLTGRPRGLMVIDLFGLSEAEVRQRFPEVYQHVLATVKPSRDTNNRASYRELWWIFGEPRRELRPALEGLDRYIATVETAKHRVFQFLDASILPDNMLVCIALDDPFHLGVLSSRIHVMWALRAGGWLGVGNDPRYSKSRCFDPFPFPDASDDLKAEIRAVAEELDAHRKTRQAEHPHLTITQMYNVLEKLKAGAALTEDEERIKDEGLVLILKELHERLDALVFEAYGWPETLSDEEILSRLVELNKKRAVEEAVGNVRWLRPEYQIPRFGSEAEKARLAEEKRREEERMRPAQAAFDLGDDLREMMPNAGKPDFPTGDELKETAAVMNVLAHAAGPLGIEAIAQQFSQGKHRDVKRRIELTVLALARLGHLASSDGGETFTLRRAA